MTKRRLHAEPRKPWTKANDRQLRKLYPHQPTADVSKTIGRSLSATYQRAKTLGTVKTAKYLSSPAAHRLDGVKGMGTRFQPGQKSSFAGALQRQINKREGKREQHNQRPA
jgi:hypothetical protein